MRPPMRPRRLSVCDGVRQLLTTLSNATTPRTRRILPVRGHRPAGDEVVSAAVPTPPDLITAV